MYFIEDQTTSSLIDEINGISEHYARTDPKTFANRVAAMIDVVYTEKDDGYAARANYSVLGRYISFLATNETLDHACYRYVFHNDYDLTADARKPEYDRIVSILNAEIERHDKLDALGGAADQKEIDFLMAAYKAVMVAEKSMEELTDAVKNKDFPSNYTVWAWLEEKQDEAIRFARREDTDQTPIAWLHKFSVEFINCIRGKIETEQKQFELKQFGAKPEGRSRVR